jgi:hypothetical protein
VSNSNTLVRKLNATRNRLSETRRIKKGTPDRRILSKEVVNGQERSFHATKGPRVERVSS